jgi:hypothetical protein
MSVTRISDRQIDLRTVFSPEQLLLSNGYEVLPPSGTSGLLIDENDPSAIEALYACFELEKARNELRRFVYSEIPGVTQSENNQLILLGSFQKDRKKFDNSLEWFAGELMIRKFAAFSAGRGITVRDTTRGSTGTEAGDYDALCVLRNLRLAYFECKSGSFDAEHVLKCYERMQSLNCQFSIIICHKPFEVATLNWLSEKVRLPQLFNHTMYRFNIRGNTTNFIYEFNNCYLIDMAGDLVEKIRTVLRVNEAKRMGLHSLISISTEDYESVGYDCVDFHGPVDYRQTVRPTNC